MSKVNLFNAAAVTSVLAIIEKGTENNGAITRKEVCAQLGVSEEVGIPALTAMQADGCFEGYAMQKGAKGGFVREERAHATHQARAEKERKANEKKRKLHSETLRNVTEAELEALLAAKRAEAEAATGTEG